MRHIFPIGPCLAATLFLLSGCGGSSNPGTPAPVLPGTPGNLTATAGDGQVNLTWTAAADADNYTVVYVEANAPERVHQLTGVSGSPYLVTGLLDNVPYGFAVLAVNGAGSTDSAGVAATPVPAVSLVSIAITPASASLGWPAHVTFSAVGTYSDGTTPDITSAVAWFSDTPAVAMTNGASLSTEATGSATITAHLAGVTSNPATVVVGAEIGSGSGTRTTTTTTTTSTTTSRIPMDVLSILEDDSWSATQVAITQQPAHGVASVAGLAVHYTPAAGYFGPDSMVVQETSDAAQIIQVGDVVLGTNLNTNTNTNTITLSVE